MAQGTQCRFAIEGENTRGSRERKKVEDRMFHPKLGQEEGAEVKYERIEGMMVGIASGDQRGSFFGFTRARKREVCLDRRKKKG